MNLTQLRLTRKLSLHKAAQKMNISPTYLCELEHNNRIPSLGTMNSIAQAYEVDIVVIFNIICILNNINCKATKEIKNYD